MYSSMLHLAPPGWKYDLGKEMTLKSEAPVHQAHQGWPFFSNASKLNSRNIVESPRNSVEGAPDTSSGCGQTTDESDGIHTNDVFALPLHEPGPGQISPAAVVGCPAWCGVPGATSANTTCSSTSHSRPTRWMRSDVAIKQADLRSGSRGRPRTASHSRGRPRDTNSRLSRVLGRGAAHTYGRAG